jgi:transcriptional regulator with XRE-family HTH domain
MMSPIDWKHTGKLVAQKRVAAGFTQRRLAEKLSISVRALSELERGVIIRPSAQILEAARTWLGPKLPERGKAHPIPPTPTPILRREDVAEGMRQFTCLATADPTFWEGIAAAITAHCNALEKGRPRT